MADLPGNKSTSQPVDEANTSRATAEQLAELSRAVTRRTRVCIWIIVIGLVNFLVYAILYMFINGEAVNGRRVPTPDGQTEYFLQSGQQVSKGVFIYSGIHSISVWVTVAAVMLAMLTLAKDRIMSSMRSTILRGRTFITILATIITFTSVVLTIWFTLQFAKHLCP